MKMFRAAGYLWYPSPGPLARATLSRWERDSVIAREAVRESESR